MKEKELIGITSGAQLLELVGKALIFNGGVPAQEPRDPSKVIDRKFVILAFNPSNGKVYTEDDALLLCAKDKAVVDGLWGYYQSCKRMEVNPEHLESIELLMLRVVHFQQAMGGGRVPDTVGAELPRCLKGEGL